MFRKLLVEWRERYEPSVIAKRVQTFFRQDIRKIFLHAYSIDTGPGVEPLVPWCIL